MLVDKLGNVVDLVVDNHVQAVLGVVTGDVLVAERSGHSGGNVEIGNGRENKRRDRGVPGREGRWRGRLTTKITPQGRERGLEEGEEKSIGYTTEARQRFGEEGWAAQREKVKKWTSWNSPEDMVCKSRTARVETAPCTEKLARFPTGQVTFQARGWGRMSVVEPITASRIRT